MIAPSIGAKCGGCGDTYFLAQYLVLLSAAAMSLGEEALEKHIGDKTPNEGRSWDFEVSLN